MNTPADTNLYDDQANAKQALADKLKNTSVPGYQVAFDPNEAEQLGAFTEDALSESDAMDSAADLSNADVAG